MGAAAAMSELPSVPELGSIKKVSLRYKGGMKKIKDVLEAAGALQK
jgi:hypothetical protein